MTLSGDGIISGTVGQPGSFSVTVTATDLFSRSGSMTFTWAVTVAMPDLTGALPSDAWAAVLAAGLIKGGQFHIADPNCDNLGR